LKKERMLSGKAKEKKRVINTRSTTAKITMRLRFLKMDLRFAMVLQKSHNLLMKLRGLLMDI